MDDRSEGSLIEMDHARHQNQKIINKPLRRRVTIDILPDDVLLVVFDYYVAEAYERGKYDVGKYEEWQVLVHVCQKWRYVVFRSPLGLNLRILCSAGTPVREKLAVWPPLPIIIKLSTSKCGEDNIIAALGHNDRVCEIDLIISSSPLESIFAAMQKTFVALEDLKLFAFARDDDTAPVVPDSFLGGSAPHLRHLWLTRIAFPFPVFRNLPLSAPNLVILSLGDIPHSGYFSPEAMVTCLSALTRLKHLCIGFKSPRSHPSREGRHPPPTRSILPALTMLKFVGVSEYLEDLITRIDAPLLNRLRIIFFHQLIFHTPQLVQFISHTPKLKAYDEACVFFSYSCATTELPGRNSLGLELGVSCEQSDRRLSSLAQLCTSSFPQALVPKLEHLYINEDLVQSPLWQDGFENNQWLELFHQFTAVKNLYLSLEIVPHIVPALQELVGEAVTEVLPNLQSIFLEDPEEYRPVSDAIWPFIATRQLSSRPIAIFHWDGSPPDDVDD